MKDTEILKAALEKAITECNEIVIKDVASGCGIKHIKSNDLLVMCRNLMQGLFTQTETLDKLKNISFY